MADSQQLQHLGSRWESARDSAASATNHLMEVVRQHGLNEHDPLWVEAPGDSERRSAHTEFEVSPDESESFHAMNDTERQEWFQQRQDEAEAKRKRKQESLPGDVRAALVRKTELDDLEFQAAKKLAEGMYERGLIGLIADQLLLQDDSEIEQYLSPETLGTHD